MFIRATMAVTVLLASGQAFAQSTSIPAGLRETSLPTAFVLDDRGVETRGRLLRLDDESVVVLVGGGERRFETRRVRRVSTQGDSLKNGTLTGLAVGVVLGVMSMGAVDCGGGCDRGVQLALAATSAVIYTAIGTAIDAAIQGRTTVYEAPVDRKASWPMGGPSVAVRLRW